MDGVTVLIADDHPVVRQGLRVLLEVQDDIEVIGEASDGAEAASMAPKTARIGHSLRSAVSARFIRRSRR